MKGKISLSISAVIVLELVIGFRANAQKIELSPLIGYETAAKASTQNGYLYIGDGMDYGGAVDIGVGGGRYAEFSYTHVGTHLDNEDTRICDLAVDYYSFGFLQELKPEARATPFGLFSLGWVNYRPTTGDLSNVSQMHLSFAAGAKIMASERIGIRLQARLLLPLYYAGSYFTAGTGGTGYSTAAGVRGVQGDFTAALVLRLR